MPDEDLARRLQTLRAMPDVPCCRPVFTHGIPELSAPILIGLSFRASMAQVRNALTRVRAALDPLGLSDDCISATELVLAEILNNVVEHAYRAGSGTVELELRHAGQALLCTVRDNGLPMPNGSLPTGRAGLGDPTCAELPEGGFGWPMIRSLARNLSYRREAGQNRLCFLLPFTNCPDRARMRRVRKP